MSQLPPEYREPLALAAAGLAYVEIAQALGLLPSNVKIRVHRARLRLASRLQAAGPPRALPVDAELAALKRTREYIRLRTIFIAAAVLFTLVPLVFVFDSAGLRFLILGHYDGLAWAFWSLAAASWVAWWVMHRSVAKAGR